MQVTPPRQMYRQTTYFNNSNPDQYTYLQYWRRRMCYNTYLHYMGNTANPMSKAPCVAYNRVNDYRFVQ